MTALLLFGGLFVFLLLRVPVPFALALGCLAALLWQGDITLMLIAQRTANSLDHFALLAVPLFILVGQILSHGRCGQTLVYFSQRLVGSVTGGLAQANVLASMFFGGISGAATADTAAIGSVMIPMMVRAGYDAPFSTVVTVTSSIIGIIVPPSIDLILFGWISGTSITELFAGGLIPGTLVGIALMGLSYVISRRRGYRSEELFSWRELGKSFLSALPVLVMPLLILGGIFGGIFTATEAAAIAFVYGVIITTIVYKDLSPRDVPELLQKAAITIGSVMFLIALVSTFGWILTAAQIPLALSNFFLTYLPSQQLFLLNTIIISLIVGTFLTPASATIILTPILFPVSRSFGLDPIHFGLVLVVALAIGHVTPPVGLTLFIGSSISQVPIPQLIRPLLPFLAVLVATVLIIAYVPEFTLFIPRLLR